MKSNRYLLFSLLFISLPIFSPLPQLQAQGYFCGSSVYESILAPVSPEMKQREKTINDAIHSVTYSEEALEHARTNDDNQHYVFPVVFHILHQNGPENIPDSQVFRSLDQLNAAFANEGYYDQGIGEDVNVSFCLAQRDKFGQPSNGINRIYDPNFDTLRIHDDFSHMYRAYSWPSDKVINIYVVKNIDFAGAFASLPWSHPKGDPQDGITTRVEYVGTDDSTSSVMAHEMGHWLGLYHTFQGGCPNWDCTRNGDLICDTPPDSIAVTWEGCVTHQNNCETDADDLSENNPFSIDQPDAHTNYMDYNRTSCYNSFTLGQKDRMRSASRLFRKSNYESEYCAATNAHDVTMYEIRRPSQFTCDTDSIRLKVRFINNSPSFLQYIEVNYRMDEDEEQTYIWRGLANPAGDPVWVDLPNVATPEPGPHRLHIRLSNPNGLPDAFPPNDSMSHAFFVPGIVDVPWIERFNDGLPTDWFPRAAKGNEWVTRPTFGCEDFTSGTDEENQSLSLEFNYSLEASYSRYYTP
ncbi:MAG: M43 family zinc metalloprotease, partial [Bacteroidota bacterium]